MSIDTLTEREIQVVRLYAKNWTYSGIGKKLKISANTAIGNLRDAIDKLRLVFPKEPIGNPWWLVKYALATGLTEPKFQKRFVAAEEVLSEKELELLPFIVSGYFFKDAPTIANKSCWSVSGRNSSIRRKVGKILKLQKATAVQVAYYAYTRNLLTPPEFKKTKKPA